MCIAVTCHLHFWQNDRDLVRATVVTRGVDIPRPPPQKKREKKESAQKVDHGERKKIRPLLSGLEPATLLSQAHCSTSKLSPFILQQIR